MEVFKFINDNKYEIGSFGTIISHTKHGKGCVLKPTASIHGYLIVRIYINGKAKSKPIHKLVADAFIHNPENKPCVNHINGVKTDNRVENLEWVTHSENTLHGYKIGTNVFSESQKKMYSERMTGKTGELARRKKAVTDGDLTFATIKLAANYYKIKHKTLCAMLSGQIKNKTNLKFI